MRRHDKGAAFEHHLDLFGVLLDSTQAQHPLLCAAAYVAIGTTHESSVGLHTSANYCLTSKPWYASVSRFDNSDRHLNARPVSSPIFSFKAVKIHQLRARLALNLVRQSLKISVVLGSPSSKLSICTPIQECLLTTLRCSEALKLTP